MPPEISYPRRKTKPCRIGNITMGNGHPVVVQSMITEETRNVEACVEQIIDLHKVGCEIVRVTTPTLGEASCLEEIKAKVIERYQDVPMTADVHHQGTKIAIEAAKYVDEIRINPGLFVFKRHGSRGAEVGSENGDMRGRTEENQTSVEALRAQLAYSETEWDEELAAIEEEFVPVVEACKKFDRAMRVGVNHGSLSERILITYGDTPRGMVESALEYLRICEKHEYYNLNISAKASRVPVMLQANRLMAERMDSEGMNYPLHLGVTEAGDGQYARIKSTAGIATLLMEGIGDTIRVSLAGPEERNPRFATNSASHRPPQNAGGIHRLPQLWSHQVRSPDGAERSALRHQAPGWAGHRRDGVHCERPGRNGRRRLWLCGGGGRQDYAVPQTRCGEDGDSARARG
ncbi:MAG: (E)-4-hydroxy-3-methylbut-2-enyl-diphosphate synthase [Fimbriimonadaceae bacterium]